MKRYQVYLNPQSVGTIDEAAKQTDLSRSLIIREAIDGAADRISNLLAALKPTPPTKYSVIDEIIDSLVIEDKESVKISEKTDEIYYQ